MMVALRVSLGLGAAAIVVALLARQVYAVAMRRVCITGSWAVERLCYEVLRQAQRYEMYCRPKRIFIIRHGESEGNIDKSLFGTKPDPFHSLTALGVDQARSAGREIQKIVGNESVYFQVSPYKRTRQTLQHMLEAFDIDRQGAQVQRLHREYKVQPFSDWMSPRADASPRTTGFFAPISRGSAEEEPPLPDMSAGKSWGDTEERDGCDGSGDGDRLMPLGTGGYVCTAPNARGRSICQW